MNQLTKQGLFDDFTGVFSKSLTLRFGLEPIGKTKENLDNYWETMKDEERNLAYPIVKRVLDREYQKLITRVLGDLENTGVLDWSLLAELLNNSRDKIQQEIKKEQAVIRKIIANRLKQDPVYKKLRNKNIFNKKGYLLTQPLTMEEKEAIKLFDKFTTFFSKYNENRKNYFSADAKGTAVANRIVNENFPKHLNNVIIFEKVIKDTPDLIEKVEHLCADYSNWKTWFTVNGYNNALTQNGIDTYNEVVGIYNREANLYLQQNASKLPDGHPLKKRKTSQLTVLFKQIASDKESKVKIDKFSNDEDVFETLEIVRNRLKDKNIIKKLELMLNEKETFVSEKVYISSKALSEVSLFITKKEMGSDVATEENIEENEGYRNWSFIENALINYWKKQKFSKISEDKIEAKIEKEKKSTYSMNQIQEAIDYTYPNIKNVRVEKWYDKLSDILDVLKKKTVALEDELKIWRNNKSKSLLSDDIDFLKQYLDAWLELIRYCKSFQCDTLENALKEEGLYSNIEYCLYELDEIVYFYNKVRNYVTQKPYSIQKMPLKFGHPTLGTGWSIGKDDKWQYNTVIFKKDGLYYLGVLYANSKIEFSDKELENGYQLMLYRQQDIKRFVTRCSTKRNEVQAHFEISDESYILNNDSFKYPLVITREIYNLSEQTYDGKSKWQKEYLTNHPEDKKGYMDAVEKWNRFCMEFLLAYKTTANYDYSEILPIEEYQTVSDLYDDLNKILYQVEFAYVQQETIDTLVEEDVLFLFKIYNKDYAKGKKEGSTKNLHTLYWEMLFSEENLNKDIIKLNGGAEIFKRPKSAINTPVIHKAGEVLVNKRRKDGTPIPNNIYRDLCHYFNGREEKMEKTKEEISEFINDVYTSTRSYDLIKDRRFLEDKYEFHVPITLNYQEININKVNLSYFNSKVIKTLQQYPDVNILGLDRGERNLISYTLINQEGKILKQGSFNEINKMNYQEKLAQREKERTNERQSWKHIENIKELKEGYISQVVHEIAKMMVEYNAIVVMENLNFGFKRGRFKVERQVYQKFEVALLQKLQYLVVDKNEQNCLEKGGILKGLQMATEVTSLKNIGKQCGFVFYIPAGYTSKIDPTTGFVDVFDMSRVTTQPLRKEFFEKFDDIYYDKEKDMFAFQFNYDNFAHYQTMAKKDWIVYTNGSRYVWRRSKEDSKKGYDYVNPTERLKKLFEENQIDYKDGNSIKIAICNALENNNKLGEGLLYNFRIALRLRNSMTSEEMQIDQIISPVLNSRGEFFETPRVIDEKSVVSEYPIDADTNGAYHIALKGLYLLTEKFSTLNLEDGKIPKEAYDISNAEWFAYRQKE